MPVGKHSPNSEKWLFMPIKAIQTEEDLAQPQQLMTHHNICSGDVELSIGAKHLMSSAPPSVERND